MEFQSASVGALGYYSFPRPPENMRHYLDDCYSIQTQAMALVASKPEAPRQGG